MTDAAPVPMDVVILAGGKGTRLAELTHDTPKGLAPIGDRPILWHIMSIFAAQGHRRFVICTGYQGQRIADHFADPANCGADWEVVTSDAGLQASKSRRIQVALEHVHSDRFWLAYGDDLANVDLAAVDRQARESDTIVTLSAVQPMSPFGVLDLAEDGKILGFQEKCPMSEWINGGFMSVSRAIGNYLHRGELEREVFEALVAEGRLSAHRHRGFWKAMNTHKQYLEFNEISGETITDDTSLPWQEPA